MQWNFSIFCARTQCIAFSGLSSASDVTQRANGLKAKTTKFLNERVTMATMPSAFLSARNLLFAN